MRGNVVVGVQMGFPEIPPGPILKNYINSDLFT